MTNDFELVYYSEPNLMFGSNQKASDPRDGLVLFGPYETLAPYKIRVGLVGTQEGKALYESFVTRMNRPFYSTKTIYGRTKDDAISRPNFPGFGAIFGIKWAPEPEIFKSVNKEFIDQIIKREKNKRSRTLALVNHYLEKIKKATDDEDDSVDIWFLVIPRNLYFGCKPNAAGKDLSKETRNLIEQKKKGQTSLGFLDEYIAEAEKLVDVSNDFHHVIKAKLIQERIKAPVQIILEPTLSFKDKYRNKPFGENINAHLAWTQSTTLYYKLGKLPWKLNDIRDGVCYLGLVFKKLNNDSGSACSAAQMFLKDGDGSVFRGNIGLWKSKNSKEYHLDKKSSQELLAMALEDYFDKWKTYPKELFIHGKARFTDEEWSGFTEAVTQLNAKTKLVGIVIKDSPGLKLFREAIGQAGNYGVLRGLALHIDEKEAYLFTRGFIPRINTSSSLEIPNPLHISVSRGEATMSTVLQDVLALTKLNYNACIHGDGLPVTLRFSNQIGEILTATDNMNTNQRQFKYYI